MSAFEQFDPFEQRITAALGELAPARRPDYLDDVLHRTARTSQRPRWSFPGRWFAFLDGTVAPGPVARAPMRPLLIVAIVALLALAATAMFVAGSRPSLPFPVGPAGNGAIVYPSGGDLLVRDAITSAASIRSLVTGQAKQLAPYLSPDGQTVAYVETSDGGDYLWAIDIDGTNQRRLLSEPIGDGWSQMSWALDSRHLLVSGIFPGGAKRLYDVRADGSGARELVFEGLTPWEAFWSPTDPDTFLLRAQSMPGVGAQGLYLVRADGTIRQKFQLTGQSNFGPPYTLSGAVWAPDGRTIAYNSISTNPDSLAARFRIHVVNADGTGDRELPGPDDDRINEAWPIFSPDGTQLLVQHFIFPTGEDTRDGAGWIAVMPADGSAPARDIGARIDATSNPDTWKDWSPDGTMVLQGIGETGKAYVVDPVTGDATELPWADDIPAWQRVSR
jgi:Tol biopolymer transport system component